jgi:hypothetical protein
MYELWMSRGQPAVKVDEFSTLFEACEAAQKGIRNLEGSFGIKYPNGDWHEWRRK